MESKMIHASLFGLATGDALGVPVEFKSREYLKQNPVRMMTGYGTHHQPAGTWSDDSSLAFCLAESLCRGYQLKDVAKMFIEWYDKAYWTPHGEVFDIGNGTTNAIIRLKEGIYPAMAGGADENDNGNGSLMRILPLLFFIKDKSIEQRFHYISEISSLTHRHIRSILSCFIYLEFALMLLSVDDKYKAFEKAVQAINDFIDHNPVCSDHEINQFHRILHQEDNLQDIDDESEIESSGYVVSTLEASIWCLLKENTFEATVLKAVNLGKDTDTVGAVTGGIAGICYGYEAIPQQWISQLARKEDIMWLCDKLEAKYGR